MRQKKPQNHFKCNDLLMPTLHRGHHHFGTRDHAHQAAESEKASRGVRLQVRYDDVCRRQSIHVQGAVLSTSTTSLQLTITCYVRLGFRGSSA